MLFDPRSGGEREVVMEDPREIPVPFLNRQMGLGSMVSRLTSVVGIPPCGGCKKRAEELDRRVMFVPWDE